MLSLESLKPLALFLLRLALGIIFVFHGYPKLFTHTREAIAMFEKMQFPGAFAYLAGVFEFFGGLVLILGIFTRVAALLLTCEMAVALWRVHLPQGPITQVKNYEFPLLLATACFALATIGAGAISLDHVIFGARRGAVRKSRGKE